MSSQSLGDPLRPDPLRPDPLRPIVSAVPYREIVRASHRPG